MDHTSGTQHLQGGANAVAPGDHATSGTAWPLPMALRSVALGAKRARLPGIRLPDARGRRPGDLATRGLCVMPRRIWRDCGRCLMEAKDRPQRAGPGTRQLSIEYLGGIEIPSAV